MVWLAIAQGITLASIVRSCTMPIASRMPSPAPSTKPAQRRRQRHPAVIDQAALRGRRHRTVVLQSSADHLVRRRQPRPLLAQGRRDQRPPAPASPRPARPGRRPKARSAPRPARTRRQDPSDHRQHRHGCSDAAATRLPAPRRHRHTSDALPVSGHSPASRSGTDVTSKPPSSRRARRTSWSGGCPRAAAQPECRPRRARALRRAGPRR